MRIVLMENKKHYATIEVRWFLSQEPKVILDWFGAKGKTFKNKWDRSDFYAALNGNPNLSLKIREGRLELKTLIQTLGAHDFADNCIGVIEKWTKWEIELKPGIDRLNDIFKDEKSFIEIRKERLLVMYADQKNLIEEVDENQNIQEGCRVELTRIGIDQQIFISFGFEAFGSEPHMTKTFKLVTQEIFAEMKNTNLSEMYSFSYPFFIANTSLFKD
jgi:hypothetical protein